MEVCWATVITSTVGGALSRETHKRERERGEKMAQAANESMAPKTLVCISISRFQAQRRGAMPLLR